MAADTVASVAPKNTILLTGVASKLVPVMVTVVLTGPLVGENEVMVGTGTHKSATVNVTGVDLHPVSLLVATKI